MSNSRWLCAVMIVSVAMGGSLGSALAQVQMQPDLPAQSAREPASTAAKVGAGVLNVVYVPGKAITCGVGTIVAGAFMLVTFGSAHREATSFFNEGCAGPWLLTPEQVAAAPKTVQIEY